MKTLALLLIGLSTLSASALSVRTTAEVWACALDGGVIDAKERLECFTIDEDGDTVAIREFHGGTCKGDPNTAPTRAYFSYKNGKLGYEYFGEDWVVCPK